MQRLEIPLVGIVKSDAEMAAFWRQERYTEAKQHERAVLPETWRGRSAQEMLAKVSPRFLPAVRQYGFRGNVLLLGSTRSGKSTAAAYLWKRFVFGLASRSGDDWSDALRARWVSARRLAEARRESRLGAEVDLIERAKRASLLVLDDLGQDGSRTDVFEVIDHRYSTGLPTIITSGLTIHAIEERYGAEVSGRLQETRGERAIIAEDWR